MLVIKVDMRNGNAVSMCARMYFMPPTHKSVPHLSHPSQKSATPFKDTSAGQIIVVQWLVFHSYAIH